MTDRGLLIVISGPSGVGKDTLLNAFLEENGDCALSISATTRPPREGEVSGRDYFFIGREEFGELAARGEMLEYAEYNGNYYGTPKEAVEIQLAQGRNVILEIDVQGALQIKESRPDAVFVFVAPPSWDTLETRLSKRGTEDSHSLACRLDAARSEMQKAQEYDYIVVNDDLQECLVQFRAVVTAAACRAENRREFLQEVLQHA